MEDTVIVGTVWYLREQRKTVVAAECQEVRLPGTVKALYSTAEI